MDVSRSTSPLSLRSLFIPRVIFDVIISQQFIWDYLTAFTIIFINRKYLKHLKHYERFYTDGDPALSYPFTDCVLPHDASWTYVFIFYPIFLVLIQIIGILIVPSIKNMMHGLFEMHAAYLSLFESYSLASTIKHILEMSGKLRPDWFARLATGDPAVIQDGRESYPSGHALYPTLLSTLLSLYLLGKFRVLSTSYPGQFAVFTLVCSIPIIVATTFAMDRVECYDHSFVDSVAGALLGTVCGALGYFLNFHSVTDAQLSGKPKIRTKYSNYFFLDDHNVPRGEINGSVGLEDGSLREPLL